MKKTIVILIILFFLLFIKNEKVIPTMKEKEIKGNGYELIFDEELLNFRNFKLKLGLFTSYEYNITKIYIDYPEKIEDKFNNKEYFSFESNNFNKGIEKLKEEYKNCLKNRYLYEELEKDIDETTINKIEIYTEEAAIIRLKNKFPNVKVKQIDKY